jgi:hypothetical protein
LRLKQQQQQQQKPHDRLKRRGMAVPRTAHRVQRQRYQKLKAMEGGKTVSSQAHT